MLFLLPMACLTPNWPISLQIHAGLTILGISRLRGLFCTPKSCIMAWLRGYLTVGLANLTVKMGCSHYKLTREVERSDGRYWLEGDGILNRGVVPIQKFHCTHRSRNRGGQGGPGPTNIYKSGGARPPPQCWSYQRYFNCENGFFDPHSSHFCNNF